MKVYSPSSFFTSAVRLMALCGGARQSRAVATAITQEGDLGSGHPCNRSQRNRASGEAAWKVLILAFILLALIFNQASLYAQPDPPSRPILFVHGWCGNAYDWTPLFEYLFPGPPATSPIPASMYTNQTVYLVEYNRSYDKLAFWIQYQPQSGQLVPPTPIMQSNIPSDARLFAINFYDSEPSSTDPTDPVNVARISVLNKAYEIAIVTKAIEQITSSKDVNIVAHSMGGLDARAYVENLASVGSCYDYGSDAGNSFYDYTVATCLPGSGLATYDNDVANIITLDTPHDGSPLANSWQSVLSGLPDYTCRSTITTNSSELVPDNVLLNSMNYGGLPLGDNIAKPNNLSTRIQAIEDYDSNAESTWTGLSGGLSDDVVPQASQSVEQHVLGSDNSPYLKDIPIPYSSATINGMPGCSAYFGFQYLGPMIHYLSCLGTLPQTTKTVAEQLTSDSVPWISSWSVTPSSVSLGNSFTIQFTATDLSTSTLSSATLWRAPDLNGQPGTWNELPTQQLSGDGPSPVTFTDKPPTTGAYWYGAELRDSGGSGDNGAWGQSSSPVVVSSGSTTAYTLTVKSSNPASGVTVRASPSDNNGLGAGSTSFSLTYNQSAKVNLTAPATAGGNSFSTWTGCDQASGITCTVTMSGAKAVTANYSTLTAIYTLTVNSANPASGVGIAASPADNGGLSFGTSSFALTYKQNTAVTLTAPTTVGGNNLSSWAGCDLTLGNACIVAITASREVTANYTPSTSTTQVAHFGSYPKRMLSCGQRCTAGGILFDGSGNLFVAGGMDYAVHEMLAADDYSTVKSLGNGFNSPIDVAVDRNGNVFVADEGNSAVKEILAAGGYVTVNTLGSGFSYPAGVAVDGGGNVFVADYGNNAVKEILAAGDYTAVKTLGSGFNEPWGVKVDESGDVFVTDMANAAVKEILADGGYTTIKTLGGGFNGPQAIAVDGSGNVFVADWGNRAVKEILVAGGYSNVKTLVSGSPCYRGVAVDASGNIFCSGDVSNGGVVELATGTVDFGTVAIGQTSAAIPLYFMFDTDGTLGSFAALNGGNELDFATASGGTCTANTAYTAGTTCTVNATFTPQSAGIHGGAVALLDGSGNTIATAYLQGTGTSSTGGTATLSSISVSPASATISPGGTQHFTATGTYSDSSTQDLTGTATWISSNTNVATINASGLATAVAGGSAYISASLNGVNSNTSVLAVNSDTYIAPTEPVGTAGDTQTATILLSSSFTLQSISVVTQGAPNLDFNLAPGGTCNVGTAYTAGQTCTVRYTFTPNAPGQRMGAILLLDGGGFFQATEYISGNGTGPLVSFLPGSQSTIGSGFISLKGVATDASGNVFVADSGNNGVEELTAASSYTTSIWHTGFNNPTGVAIDGAGNVFVADSGNNAVKEILTASGSAPYRTLGGTFNAPWGVAVDASGNVFVADSGNNAVKEILAASGYTTVNTLGSGFNGPKGIAIDGAGNVFVGDSGNGKVKEIVASGGYATVNTLGSGFGAPMGVALDTSGNVYVADSSNNAVKEILVTTSYTTVNTLGSGFNTPSGVAVAGNGNVFVADSLNNRIVKVDLADAPSLSFASTAIGSTSSDSPKTVTLANTGNAALTFPIPSSGNNPSVSPNFSLNSSGGTACPVIGSTATSAGTLEAGASCTLAISFAPTITGSLSGSLVLTDNNLNVPSATQTITLGGTATAATKTTPTVTVAPTPSSITTAQTLSVTVTVNGGSGNPTPTGSVTLVGGTFSGNGTLSNGSATISIPAGAFGVGTDQLTATYTPDSASSSAYNGATGVGSVTVTAPAKITPAVTVTPSPSSITTAQALSVSVTVSGGSGNPAATGSVTLVGGTFSGNGILSNGSTTISIPAGAFAVGTDQLTATYTPDSASSSAYNGATGVGSVIVTAPAKITPAVTVTPNPSSITIAQTLSVTVTVNGGNGNPTPTGSVTLVGGTFSGNGILSNGSTTISIPAGAFAVGSDQLTATYTPDSASSPAYNGATGVGSVTVTAPAKITPAVTVTPSPSSITTAQTLSVTVTVNGGSGNPTPTGSVTLLGGTFSGNGTLSNGSATISIPAGAFAVGTDQLTATYTPDSASSSAYNGATGVGSVTVSISSTGGRPQMNFLPGILTTLGGGFSSPAGVAVDGSGNVFVADTVNNAVKEIPFNCLSSSCTKTLGSGFSDPEGVAVDGSGNVFVADTDNSAVKEILAAGGYTTVNTLASGFLYVSGVAVDGSGNVFVADEHNGSVKEFLVAGGYTTVNTLASGFTGTLTGIAVDGSGNVFVADGYNKVVEEILAAGGYTSIKTLGSGFNQPYGVAVDRSGNVFVADTDNSAVKEILVIGGYTTVNTVVSGIVGSYAPFGVAVDGSGNVFVADWDGGNQGVRKLDLADAPSLSFASTAVGSTSSDSPQTVTLFNNGNTALTFSIPSSGNNPSISTNFTLNSSGGTACPLVGSTASSVGTLVAGASCTLSISFAPTAAGSLSGSLVLTDNNLNVPSATQTISLSGTATAATKTTPTVTVTPNPTSITTAQTLSVTVTVSGGSGNPPPTGSVTLVGGTFSGNGTLSNGRATISIPAGAFAVGTDQLTATYTPDSASSSAYNGGTGVGSVTVTTPAKITPAVTVTPNSSSITTAQTLSVTVTVNGGSGNPPPTGSVTLVGGTFSGNGTLSSGSATISIPAGAFAVGTDQLTATYTPDSGSSSTYNSATGAATVTVTQANPVPVIGSLSPAFTGAGGTAFTLTVNGTGFVANSTVYWGTTALVTQYGSATQLTAQVPASDIVNAGITAIAVQTPTPGGGTSNSLKFEVDSAGSGTTPPTFTTITATVSPGAAATYSVTLPSSATFDSVTCLNAPSGAQCSYSTTSNTLTISTSSTTPAGTYQITVVFTETLPGPATGFILLPILLLPLLFLRRKLAARGLWFTICLGLVLMTAAAFSTGCGGSTSGGGGSPPPQTHTVTSSGTVSLTVQ